MDAVLIKPDYPENIEEFGNNMKAVIAELFREAVGLAQYVYEECFVNGKDVEEILNILPEKLKDYEKLITENTVLFQPESQ